ncbi:hypothetical protein Bbelb_045000 [Branchiostoma belcheri]|nr:hypothetical protein Bbelb_045000 [Branchiostoma belcheri]
MRKVCNRDYYKRSLLIPKMIDVRRLYLGWNHISHLHPDTFRHLSRLKIVHLNNNNICAITEGARPRLVEPSSDTGTKVARSTHEFKNFAQVGRDTKEGRPNISQSSREGRPRNTTETRGMYVRISVDSRPHRDELRASYARAGNELCDLNNRRRLVADVKNTFRVSASFGRLQKIAGDPENSRDARRNIGRTTAVNVV